MTRTDLLEEIYTLEVGCFGDAWSKASLLCHLSDEQNNITITYEKDGRLVGYALGNHIVDEGELFRIGVLPEFRGQKIADILMTNFLSEQRKNGAEKVFLEVRSKNTPAVSLYEKFGFEVISKRKNYYSNPADDALNYLLILDKE